MDTANLVVTYGGNIALEAVYWGKNVITLRMQYSQEKFIFEPKTFKELLNYIINLKFLKNQLIEAKYYLMRITSWYLVENSNILNVKVLMNVIIRIYLSAI